MTLRAGEVAAAAGVNRETLRYYERRGLLHVPARSQGGHRRYDDASVTTLRMIKAAQRLGFTLTEIAEIIGDGRRNGRDRGLRSRAEAKLIEVERRILDLETAHAHLRAAVDAGCDDLEECATRDRCPVSMSEPG